MRLLYAALARLFGWISKLRGEPVVLVDLSEPPSHDQLRQLAQWLSRHRPHGGRLADIHALDGYLACIVAGPEPITPGEWVNAMFRNEPLPDDAEGMLQLAARHMNTIVRQLVATPAGYTPLLQTHRDLGGPADPLDAWCQGFMAATALRERHWKKLLRNKDLAAALRPISQRAGRKGKQPASSVPASQQRQTSALTGKVLSAAVLKTALATGVAH